jgi:hypothetical protein
MARDADLVVVFESHATSLDNEAGLASGWFDVALSATGEEQARQLGSRRRNEDFAAVFCSDLVRSFRTAEIAHRARSRQRPLRVLRTSAAGKRQRQGRRARGTRASDCPRRKLRQRLIRPAPALSRERCRLAAGRGRHALRLRTVHSSRGVRLDQRLFEGRCPADDSPGRRSDATAGTAGPQRRDRLPRETLKASGGLMSSPLGRQ